MVSFPQVSHQIPIYVCHNPRTCCMPHPSHYSWFDRSNNIWWGVQVIRLLLCSFLHSPVISSLLGPNILLRTLFSNTLSLRFSLNVSDRVSHPYKTCWRCTYIYWLLLAILNVKKSFLPNWHFPRVSPVPFARAAFMTYCQAKKSSCVRHFYG